MPARHRWSNPARRGFDGGVCDAPLAVDQDCGPRGRGHRPHPRL